MSATVSVEAHAGSTDYVIVGTLEEVFEAIAHLFEQYHPAGYGTDARISLGLGGYYTAKVNRANSCD